MRPAVPAALALLSLSCSARMPGAPAPPATDVPAPAPPVSSMFAGAWAGSARDSQGQTTVVWTLSATSTGLAGTIVTQAVNPDDGSCNSCHRNKRGTVTGTQSGSTLTLTMLFAAGADGDPTPACSATMTGTVSADTSTHVAGTYNGNDTCEGPFLNGTIQLDRRSVSIP